MRRADDTEIQLELARIRSIVESGAHGRGPHAANGHPNGVAVVNGLVSDKEVAAAESGASQVLTGAAPAEDDMKTALRKLVDHVACRTPTGKAFFIVMGLMTFMQLSGIDAVIFYLGEIFKGEAWTGGRLVVVSREAAYRQRQEATDSGAWRGGVAAVHSTLK